MGRVILTKGLPGSGKTTWAREKQKKNHNLKVVCRDDLRSMFSNTYHPKFEKHVVRIQQNLAKYLLEEGYNIIVADTNLNPSIVQSWKEQFGIYGVEIQDFTHIPLQQCIENDLKRLDSVGKDVIIDMYNKFLREEVEPYEPEGEIACIIVDIDGTIAKMEKRGPFEWDKVGTDSPIQPVIDLVQDLQRCCGYQVIFLSGRDGVCHQDTYKWLCDQGFDTFRLFTRKAGDMRKDVVVKRELFDEHIRPRYDPKYVIDDRLQVCRMWYELGLTLLRVGDPDADF